mmetsp:Transcript_18250/g.37640  ORF Transcript_18250/g.37640 Transcript_18250/m.37640 type:complete len:84 (+) Transcript_18250:259-510(+)
MVICCCAVAVDFARPDLALLQQNEAYLGSVASPKDPVNISVSITSCCDAVFSIVDALSSRIILNKYQSEKERTRSSLEKRNND